LNLALVGAGLLLALPVTAAERLPGDEASRVLTLLRGIGGEYREALDGEGRIVRPLEVEEARLLLAEARDHVPRPGEPLASEVGAHLDALSRAVDARAPLETVDAAVAAVRTALGAASGAGDEFLPPAPPSAARGAEVFQAQCASCHGAHGAGDGPEA